MKKKLLGRASLFATLLLVFFCCTAKADELTFVLDQSPKAIHVSHSVRVEILKGNRNEMIVSGDKEALSKFGHKMTKNGALHMGRKNADSWLQVFWKNTKSVSVKLYITDPQQVTLLDVSGASHLTCKTPQFHQNLNVVASGATKVYLEGAFTNLELDVSGASRAEISGDFVRMEADVSGASSCHLAGRGQRLEVDCSDASSVRGSQCFVDEVAYDVSGASSFKINANRVRYADTSGASSARVHEWSK